jgi:hypothetical protein
MVGDLPFEIETDKAHTVYEAAWKLVKVVIVERDGVALDAEIASLDHPDTEPSTSAYGASWGPGESGQVDGPVKASPIVCRLATEHLIELAAVGSTQGQMLFEWQPRAEEDQPQHVLDYGSRVSFMSVAA